MQQVVQSAGFAGPLASVGLVGEVVEERRAKAHARIKPATIPKKIQLFLYMGVGF